MLLGALSSSLHAFTHEIQWTQFYFNLICECICIIVLKCYSRVQWCRDLFVFIWWLRLLVVLPPGCAARSQVDQGEETRITKN